MMPKTCIRDGHLDIPR